MEFSQDNFHYPLLLVRELLWCALVIDTLSRSSKAFLPQKFKLIEISLYKQSLLTPKLISSQFLSGSVVVLCLYKVCLQSGKQWEHSVAWLIDWNQNKKYCAPHGSHNLWFSSVNGRYHGVQAEWLLLIIELWAYKIEHSKKQLDWEYFLWIIKSWVSSENEQFRLDLSNFLMLSSASMLTAESEI